MAKRWYIVHAFSNFEKKVADSIREGAEQRGLTDLFEEILVPTEKVTEVRRGRKIETDRKFFPGYVLVKVDLTDDAYHLIKNTPKVTGFLGADKKPIPIPDHEAERIKGQVVDSTAKPKSAITSSRWASRSRLGWPVRLVQRHCRGCRCDPLAPQGGGVDLRPRHAGRTRVQPGRVGL
jgi:transcription antitermination factor NusG